MTHSHPLPRYHRVFGSIAFLSMTLHGCVWWGKWLNEGTLATNIIAMDTLKLSPTHVSPQNFTMPLAEMSWALLGLSLLLGLLFRKRLYVIFQYAHKFVGIVFYIIAILHAWSFW
jgi:hypothetical protein